VRAPSPLLHRPGPALGGRGARPTTRTDPEDLEGQRVCATRGSTAIDNIRARQPEALMVEVPQRADCLLLLQQGQVDAAATDDAILAGLAAQDPNYELRGEVYSDEPYGIGLPPDREDWVRYVNAVVEDLFDSGRWDELYDRWLADVPGLDPDAGAPSPGQI
jgi:polar amino acid transport system substrate-binding protein